MKKIHSFLISLILCLTIGFSMVSLSSCSKKQALEQGMITLEQTSYVYDGTAKQPSVIVTKQNEVISPEHYVVTYQNNISVGTASVIISAADKSKELLGSVTIYFEIVKAEFSTDLSFNNVIYDGQNHYPNFLIDDYAENDYTYHWEYKSNDNEEFNLKNDENFVNVGYYKLVISGTGNYSGTKEVLFEIKPQEVQEPTVVGIYTYSGNAQEIELSKVSDLFEVQNNVQTNAGRYNLIVSLKDKANYVWETSKTSEDLNLEFEISPKSITNGNITLGYTTKTYTGEELKPGVEVVIDNVTLTSEDYDVEYTNNTNVGTASVVVTAKDNYTGSLETNFEISPKSITNGNVTLGYTTKTYTGEELKPSIEVVIDNVTLTSENYDIEYINNINVGTASVVVTAKGNYTGSLEATFEITPQEVKEPTVVGIYTYSGNEQEIELSKVSDLFEIQNNVQINAGKYNLVVSLKDKENYVWETSKTSVDLNLEFEITPKSISNGNITLEYMAQTYTGTKIKPSVEIVVDNVTLTSEDYDAEYTNNTNVGTASVTVTAKGNYTSSLEETFEITPKSILNGSITLGFSTQTYTGEELRPSVEVVVDGITLTSGDYNIEYTNNINVGTAKVVATAKGNYTGTLEETFEITPISILSGNVTLGYTIQTYIGEELKPSVEVVVDGVTLTSGDYDIEYTNNINVGAAKVVVTAKGNYTGSLETNFEITPKSISNGNVTLEYTTKTYIGEELKPSVEVVVDNETLTSEDYDVEYTNNTNVGTASVVVTAKGNYTGNLEMNFEITPKSISNGNVTLEYTTQTYKGAELKPSVEIAVDNATLTSEDYDIEYTNNTNAGTASVVVTAKGNYTGSLEATFEITPQEVKEPIVVGTYTYSGNAQEIELSKVSDLFEVQNNVQTNAGRYNLIVSLKDKANYVWETSKTSVDLNLEFEITAKSISNGNVTLEYTTKTYIGAELKPSVEVVVDNVTLTSEDYDAEYTNNINVGTASIVVTAKGNYTGTLETHFEITPKSVSNGNVTLEYTTKTYIGEELKPSVKVVVDNVTLTSEDYDIDYTNNVNVGTASIVVTAKGNYTGTLETNFEIVPKSISNGNVTLEYTTQTYTGKELRPSVEVVVNNVTLTSEDYDVEFTNNTNVGTANVVVTAKSNYTGTLETNFEITPKSISNGNVTLEYTTQTYTGEELRPSVEVTLDGEPLTSNNYELEYTNNTNAGTAKVVVTAKDNYTGTLEATFEILKKQIEEPTVSSSYAYNEAEQTILSDTDDYVVISEQILNAGTYDIVLSLKDKLNTIWKLHENSDDITIQVTIEYGVVSEPVFPDPSQKFVYNGTLQSVLEDTKYYKISNNKQTNAGTYEVIVSLVDPVNYVWKNSQNNEQLTYTFVIEQADIADTKISLDNDNFVYNSETITPTFSVEFNEKLLVLGVDYTYTLLNNVNVGTAILIVEGTGNFKLSKEIEFTILPKEVEVPSVSNYIYDGYSHNGVTESELYTVSNNTHTDAGTYTVTISLNNPNNYVWIKGNGNNSLDIETEYTISKATLNLDGQTVLELKDAEYSGLEIVDAIKVFKHGNYELAENSDYNITYKNNLNVGIATVVIVGKNNFEGEITKTFEIFRKKIEEPELFGSYTFNGNEQIISFRYNGDLFEVVDGDLVNAGTKTILVGFVDKTNYAWANTETENVEIVLTINKAKLLKPEFSGTYTYTGSEQEAELTNINDKLLVEGNKQTDAGTYTITISILDKNNYSWDDNTIDDIIFEHFIINVASLNNAEISLSESKFNYTGEEVKPEVIVVFNGKTLIENKDYTLTFSDNINAGFGSVRIKGINNFFSETIKYFEIVSGEILASNVILSSQSAVYTGEDLQPTVTVNYLGEELEYDVDYNYYWTNSNGDVVSTLIDSEKYTVNIVGLSNYTSNVKLSFVIEKASYENVTVSRESYVYGESNTAIVVSGEVHGDVKYYYSLSDDKENLVEFNESDILDANTYYLFMKIEESKNYNSYETETGYKFVISKASRTNISVVRDSYTFGSPSSIILGGYVGSDVEYYYFMQGDVIENSVKFDENTTLNIGTYNFYAVVLESTNYNEYVTGTSTFTVKSMNYEDEITVSRAGFTYGEEQTETILNGYNGDMQYVTYYYSRTNSNQDGIVYTDEDEFNAGVYYIYARITANGNYSEYLTETSTFIVSKASYNGVFIERENYTFGEEKTNINLSGQVYGSVNYYYNLTDSTENGTPFDENTELNAGTYYIFAVVEETQNYNSYTTNTHKFVVNYIVVTAPEIKDLSFNGFAQTLVSESDDYLVSDNNVQTNAGSYDITISLNDSLNSIWSDTKTNENKIVTVSITKVSLTSIVASLDEIEFTYSGTPKTPSVSASFGVYTLSSADYNLVYIDNTNAGTAQAVLRAKEEGNFKDEKILEFTILKADYSNISIVFGDYNYGDLVSLTLNEEVEGTITYYINTENSKDSATLFDMLSILNVGTYYSYAVIGDSENYNGFETSMISFSIEKAVINSSDVSISETEFEFTNEEISIEVSVTHNEDLLEVENDYTVTIIYNGNIVEKLLESGTYIVTITGINNYEGIIEVPVRVLGINISGAVTEIIGGTDDGHGNITFNYTGSAITPSVSIMLGYDILTIDVDYQLSYLNNTDIGTATIVITGINQYSGTISLNFEIVSNIASIEDATITDNGKGFDYTGKNQMSKLKYKVYLNGTLLTENVDYYVVWSIKVNGNDEVVDELIDANTYYGTIYAKNTEKYSGTATNQIIVYIYAVTIDSSSIDISLSAQSAVFAGVDVTPEVTVSKSSKNLILNKDYEIQIYDQNFNLITEIVDVGEYYIFVIGINNYTDSVMLMFEVTA